VCSDLQRLSFFNFNLLETKIAHKKTEVVKKSIRTEVLKNNPIKIVEQPKPTAIRSTALVAKMRFSVPIRCSVADLKLPEPCLLVSTLGPTQMITLWIKQRKNTGGEHHL
jgi:hypothetical protein